MPILGIRSLDRSTILERPTTDDLNCPAAGVVAIETGVKYVILTTGELRDTPNPLVVFSSESILGDKLIYILPYYLTF
jgi:hypothetical protein